jgi:transcriptional regulator with XRE-family HTH domain
MLRTRREELGFTKAELAKKLTLSASFIDVLETGRRGCNLDELPRIAAVLKLDAGAVAKVYLAERHAEFYRSLFPGAPDAVVPRASMQVEDTYWRMEQLPRRERGIVEALVYALYDLRN